MNARRSSREKKQAGTHATTEEIIKRRNEINLMDLEMRDIMDDFVVPCYKRDYFKTTIIDVDDYIYILKTKHLNKNTINAESFGINWFLTTEDAFNYYCLKMVETHLPAATSSTTISSQVPESLLASSPVLSSTSTQLANAPDLAGEKKYI
jgi:hypothetical protein